MKIQSIFDDDPSDVSQSTYFIAEIGSNFDGSKERAESLIELAAESGADAAKFQAFSAESIVSKVGFDGLKMGFQSDWKKSVYQTYKDAALPREWIPDLASCCEEHGVEFLCTPYDLDAIEILEEVGVPAYKIGSGDITWHSFIKSVANTQRPVILATGASTLGEVEQAVEVIRSTGNDRLVLLQCITDYPSGFESANLRAMRTLQQAFATPVGYSDHTPGSVVPLGAVSIGGRVIEKHFTDDTSRDGPDHSFAMDPNAFGEMVSEVRSLEAALGSFQKTLYNTETDSVILQRRCIRANRSIAEGQTIAEEDLICLRPAPPDSIPPYESHRIVNREAQRDIDRGEHITWHAI